VKTKRAVPLLRGTRHCRSRPVPIRQASFALPTQLDNAPRRRWPQQPFTKALLAHIGTKGLTIQELMIRVRKSVMQATNNAQCLGRKQP